MVRKIGVYRAGKCDACGGSLTLVQRHSDREIIGHLDECKVKNSKTGYEPKLPSLNSLANELKKA